MVGFEARFAVYAGGYELVYVFSQLIHGTSDLKDNGSKRIAWFMDFDGSVYRSGLILSVCFGELEGILYITN